MSHYRQRPHIFWCLLCRSARIKNDYGQHRFSFSFHFECHLIVTIFRCCCCYSLPCDGTWCLIILTSSLQTYSSRCNNVLHEFQLYRPEWQKKKWNITFTGTTDELGRNKICRYSSQCESNHRRIHRAHHSLCFASGTPTHIVVQFSLHASQFNAKRHSFAKMSSWKEKKKRLETYHKPCTTCTALLLITYRAHKKKTHIFSSHWNSGVSNNNNNNEKIKFECVRRWCHRCSCYQSLDEVSLRPAWPCLRIFISFYFCVT